MRGGITDLYTAPVPAPPLEQPYGIRMLEQSEGLGDLLQGLLGATQRYSPEGKARREIRYQHSSPIARRASKDEAQREVDRTYRAVLPASEDRSFIEMLLRQFR